MKFDSSPRASQISPRGEVEKSKEKERDRDRWDEGERERPGSRR